MTCRDSHTVAAAWVAQVERRRLTVAHIITDLDIGGAEGMLERLLPRLARTGVHNVVICLRTPGPIGPRIEQAGTRVLSLHVSRARPNPLGALRLRRMLKAIRP